MFLNVNPSVLLFAGSNLVSSGGDVLRKLVNNLGSQNVFSNFLIIQMSESLRLVAG